MKRKRPTARLWTLKDHLSIYTTSIARTCGHVQERRGSGQEEENRWSTWIAVEISTPTIIRVNKTEGICREQILARYIERWSTDGIATAFKRQNSTINAKPLRYSIWVRLALKQSNHNAVFNDVAACGKFLNNNRILQVYQGRGSCNEGCKDDKIKKTHSLKRKKKC